MEKERSRYLELIDKDFEIVPICVILGPRQCGKTTLARQYSKKYKGNVHYFDLEDPSDLNKLNTPKLTLEPLEGLVVIDEIQRRPELFPYLRVLVDKKNIKILILGSASRDLLQQSSETLAGRISYVELPPFACFECDDLKTLWLRGGFPRSFLASTDSVSRRWRQVYIQTYFERDLAMMGLALNPQEMSKMWHFLSQYHGHILNYAEIARFLNLSLPTAKKYLGILEGTFMIRTLSPWFENISKRQVKSPKLYIRDSGIYHSFMGIFSYDNLVLHTRVGQSWEGFAMEEVIKTLSLRTEDCYFWATHQDTELDLFIPTHKIGFEFKYTEAPRITKSMRIALETLSLDHLFMIAPLDESYALDEQVTVTNLKDLSVCLGHKGYTDLHL
ncbi:MAG: ATP-binding protein [Proteobacteria bacterium]|nr:ATP-binding protein [Pseudomonadota bacterium]